MVTNRLPPDDSAPNHKLNRPLANAAAQLLKDKEEGYLTAMRKAARSFLNTLREMGAAELRGEELRKLGVDLGASSPFGSADSLAEQFHRLGRSAVAGGLLAPDDPVLVGIDFGPGPTPPISER